jgi:hypothetical protein
LLLHKVLHIEDTPHRIALGLAVGMFMAFTPTFGLQLVLTVLVSWALRANKVVGLGPVWITNLATIAPIYYGCYWLGEQLLGSGGATLEHFQKLTVDHGGWWENMKYAWGLIRVVIWRLSVGCLLVGGVMGAITYVVGFYSILGYRVAHSKRFPGSRFDTNGRPMTGPGASKKTDS